MKNRTAKERKARRREERKDLSFSVVAKAKLFAAKIKGVRSYAKLKAPSFEL